MRGSDARSGSLFSYVDLEHRVSATHPLRTIKAIVDDVLIWLDSEFERLYEGAGRRSIAPERLLRASLLQAFYSVRSERQLMEQIDYKLLFRWFVRATMEQMGDQSSKTDPIDNRLLPQRQIQQPARSLIYWCPGAESNHRHADFQSDDGHGKLAIPIV